MSHNMVNNTAYHTTPAAVYIVLYDTSVPVTASRKGGSQEVLHQDRKVQTENLPHQMVRRVFSISIPISTSFSISISISTSISISISQSQCQSQSRSRPQSQSQSQCQSQSRSQSQYWSWSKYHDHGVQHSLAASAKQYTAEYIECYNIPGTQQPAT